MLAYYFYNSALPNLGSPPETGWVAGTGAAGALTVLRMPISGATAYQYTVQSVDSNRNLHVEVTPVDAKGLAGATIVSSSLLISN